MTNEEYKQLIQDYQMTFGTDHGKRVYDDLMTRSNYLNTFSAIVQCGLPEHTALELGKRELFLYILDKVKADPDKLEVPDVSVEPGENDYNPLE